MPAPGVCVQSRKLLERRGIGSESRAEFYDRLHKTRAMRRSAAEGGTGDRVVDDENLTFQPAINQSSQRSRSGQRLGGPAGVAGSPGYGGSDSGQGRRPNVGDTLYREAINSRIKLLLLERREEENLRQRRNARKMTATSVRYMMQRLQREVTEAVLAADVDGRGWLTYTQMVATLRTLGFLKVRSQARSTPRCGRRSPPPPPLAEAGHAAASARGAHAGAGPVPAPVGDAGAAAGGVGGGLAPSPRRLPRPRPEPGGGRAASVGGGRQRPSRRVSDGYAATATATAATGWRHAWRH